MEERVPSKHLVAGSNPVGNICLRSLREKSLNTDQKSGSSSLSEGTFFVWYNICSIFVLWKWTYINNPFFNRVSGQGWRAFNKEIILTIGNPDLQVGVFYFRDVRKSGFSDLLWEQGSASSNLAISTRGSSTAKCEKGFAPRLVLLES